MVSGQCTHGAWINSRVLSPKESVSPSATARSRSAGANPISTNIFTPLGVAITSASGYRANTCGNEPA